MTVENADPQAEWAAVQAEREATPEVPAVIEDAAPAQAAAADPVDPPEPAAADPAPDPYAGLSAEAKAKLERFDQMSDVLHQTTLTLKETQGRVSALQSEFAKRQAQPAAEAPTGRQVAAAAKDPEKWAELKKDFPEWGEGIEAYVGARIDQLQGSGLTPEAVEQIVAQRVGAAQASLGERFEKSLVEQKHPNWEAAVKTPEFQEWWKTQPADVTALGASTRAVDAMKVMDLFQARVVPKQTKTARLAAAVTTRPGPAVATKSFDELDPKEQWAYLAAERERKLAAAAG